MTIVAAALAAALAVGCGAGDGEVEPAAVPGMTEVEMQRSVQACDVYVERLCACAAALPEQPELAERCDLTRARPQALNMVLQVHGGADATEEERRRTLNTARRMVADCIQETAKLERFCPPPAE